MLNAEFLMHNSSLSVWALEMQGEAVDINLYRPTILSPEQQKTADRNQPPC